MAASCSSVNESSNNKTECTSTSPSPTETVCLELSDATEAKESAGPSRVTSGENESVKDEEAEEDEVVGSCHGEEDCEDWDELDEGESGGEDEDEMCSSDVLPSNSASAINPRTWVSTCR